MFDRLSQGLWWDRTLTLVSGCSPVSAGCANCWSANIHHRFFGVKTAKSDGLTDADGHWTKIIRCEGDRIELPFKVKKPAAWTVWNDLFHPDVPFHFQLSALVMMRDTPQHRYLILTKRPENALRFFKLLYRGQFASQEPLFNVWLGVTAENQEQADKRIPILLQTPAAIRFISVEPMLSAIKTRGCWFGNPNGMDCRTCPGGDGDCPGVFGGWGNVLAHKIDWVICGGESGPQARPLHTDWAKSLRDQCRAAQVPFFFKQWGTWAPDCLCCDGTGYKKPCKTIKRPEPGKVGVMFRCGKKAAGRTLDGKEYLELPNY